MSEACAVSLHPVWRARRLWVAWTLLLLSTLAWDASGADLAVMLHIGTPTGFALRHAPLLETVLHNGGRQLSVVLYLGLVAWVFMAKPSGAASPTRAERLMVLILVTSALATVSVIKGSSRSSCPWEWSMFGGPASYVSHWNLWTTDGGDGRCFPGGHASGAFAFLALCLPWLWPPVPGRHRAVGLRWLALVLAAGLVAGLTQTLRGAHPPSHTLWTAVICGGVALGGWALALPRLRRLACGNSL